MRIDWTAVHVEFHGAWRPYLEFDWTAGERLSDNLHEHQVWMVWAGEGFLTADLKEKHCLEPGRCFWLRPGRRYLAEQRGGERLGIAFVHFDLLDADGRPLRDGAKLPPLALPRIDPGFANTAVNKLVELAEYAVWSALPAKAVARQYRAGRSPRQLPGKATRTATGVRALAGASRLALARQASPGAWNLAAAGLLRALLMCFDGAAELPEPKRPRPWKMAPRDFAAADLARRIHANPAELPPVEELARQAGLKWDQLSRDFSLNVGMSPQHYAVFARAYQGLYRLRTSTHSIGAIARTLGYRNIGQFGKKVRELVGCTPQEFRRRAGRQARAEKLKKS